MGDHPFALLLQRIKRALRRDDDDDERQLFELDQAWVDTLTDIAEQEQRLPEEIASELLYTGWMKQQSEQVLYEIWNELTTRERQITALSCLGYTNQQIASHLSISFHTVKTHMRNAMGKAGVNKKVELLMLFEKWDFHAWE